MAEYHSKFEFLAATVGKLEEATLTAVFVNGLQEKVKAEILVLNPCGLKETMEVASRIETKIHTLTAQSRPIRELPTVQHKHDFKTVFWSPTKPFQTKTPNPIITLQIPNMPHSSTPTNKLNTSHSFTPNRFKRISEKEAQARREKGLCYRCDEKWNPNHQCKNRELNVLLVSEGDKEEKGSDEEEALQGVELSLNSVVGLAEPKTLRLRGEILGVLVVVLIDCGATHNFVSTDLVKKLRLPVTDTTDYGVIIGSGEKVKGSGICKGVVLYLQDLTVVEEFLPLQLGSLDVILGVKWLSTLGVTHNDWKRLTMSFELGGQIVVLKGDPSLNKALVSMKSMVKTISQEKEGVLIELCSLESYEGDPTLGVCVQVKEVIAEFADVFQSPTNLSPQREQDHAIVLKEGTDPIRVRPYRYP